MKAKIEELRQAVQAMHQCYATHIRSEFVPGMPGLNLTIDGSVEIFTISGHPLATRCYAWSCPDGLERRIFAILEHPPVDSAMAAVQAAIAAETENKSQIFN